MRNDTVRAARVTLRAGSVVSAAAMVATSLPIIEKITTGIAASGALNPFGKNPPCPIIWRSASPGPGPKAKM